MLDERGVKRDHDGTPTSPVRVLGTVLEVLPHGLYRVAIERQRVVTAHAPGGPGRNFVRVIVGDRVRLELSPRDLSRGRIVEKVG